jgi:hypothetical protein
MTVSRKVLPDEDGRNPACVMTVDEQALLGTIRGAADGAALLPTRVRERCSKNKWIERLSAPGTTGIAERWKITDAGIRVLEAATE